MTIMRNAYEVSVRKPEGRNHSESMGINARIILE
jgi:hypothetical protein